MRWLGWAAVVVTGLALASCALNPQPEPPGADTTAVPGSAGAGGSSEGTAGDQNTGLDTGGSQYAAGGSAGEVVRADAGPVTNAEAGADASVGSADASVGSADASGDGAPDAAPCDAGDAGD